jgi:Nitroreductase family
MHDPWHVEESVFPKQGTATDQLRFLVSYAILAPSGHNTQPWLFRVAGGALELFADRTRALPVVDPDDRALVISCGASLYTLRVAIRHFGFTDQVELFPDRLQPDLLARVALGVPKPATDDDDQRFLAIPHRRSNRQPYEPRSVPGAVLSQLQTAATEQSVWLTVAEGEKTRNAVADLVAAGDRIQASSKPFRRELAAWIHHNRTRSRDGMPGYAHGMGDLMSLLGPFVLRTFDWGDGQAARDRQLATGSPVLAVIGTAADDPPSWLAAGQALSSVLLLARAHGVSASFLNQPIEVPELRPQLRNCIGMTGYPQLLLRLGYGPNARATPRRPVAEVLVG